MLRNVVNRILPRQTVHDNIVIIDSVLPNKDAIGPRNSDFLEFAGQLPGFRYYTLFPMKPGADAWFVHGYGMTREDFAKNLPGYEAKYPLARNKIRLLDPQYNYRFNLAYTYFLAETYTMLPFLEKNKIPFAFLLNPGGAFGIDNDSSDRMLQAIFASKYFRKVIVNQRIFEKYLLRKKLCPKEKIVYDFTGSVQFKQSDLLPKKRYPADKQTFDICFVAAKYTERGIDKGYDLFIATAKRLAKTCPDMRFHVVGGFNETDIDVTDIRDSITFYGYMAPSDLPAFYAAMDIYLSPNRPFQIYQGGSDGFPLSAGAMYCGVAGFNTDVLDMNTEFRTDEVVIVQPELADICKKVGYYYKHLDELYSLSSKGQKRAHKLWDIESHIARRIELFNELTKGKS